MVTKADPKRNYYADLEISPSATTDDIKKQFRKLARLYHPDRNQGKELEFVPKFQAIQAAHEILGDADQRVKYDADRKKLGYAARPTRPPFPTAHTSSGRTAPPRSSAYTSRQHWESTHSSQPPHAPNPPPRPQTHPTRPSWYGAPQQPQSPYTASHAKPSPSGTPGATRFKEFRPPPPPRGPAPNNDSDMRSNVFSAWQSMHNKGAPKTKTGTTPSTPGSEDERRARDQGPFGKASTASPGIRRSNTTRTPRKGGFDPNLPGDFWEPPAQRTSSYTTRHSFAMPGGQTPPSDNSGASQGSSVEQERAHQPQKRHSDHGLRTTTSAPDGPLFGERLSTPYQSSGGEKLNPNKDEFRRSASVRDATRLGARFEVPESSPSSKGATPRAKSASPKDKGARRKSHQPHVIDLTDSSESSDASKPPNISLRPKAQPSRRWKSPTKNNIPISYQRPSSQSDGTHANISDPERRTSVNTEFSSTETFKGIFEGSNGFAPPPSTAKNGRSKTSPTRAGQALADPLPFIDPFKSMFPQHPNFKPVNEPINPVNEAPSQGPVKFEPKVWESTFKEPSFVLPNLATLGSQTGRPASSTGRKSRPRAMSKSEERLGSHTKGADEKFSAESQDQMRPTPKDDADAMDIDMEISPSFKGTRSAESRNVRNVTMPPHRTNWQDSFDPKPTTSSPSAIPMPQMPFSNVPTAVPNAMPPPPPPPGPPPMRSPLSPRSGVNAPATASPDRRQASLNLADLGQNLTARSSGGVSDLGDLSSTLPFDSRPSERHPSAPALGPLNIPKPPNAPIAPATRRLTQGQWKQYVSELSVYMGQWYQFDGRIMDHLQARYKDSAKFGTGVPSIQGTALLEARGDVKEGGIERWEAELEQDRRVRDFWAAACNRHQKCIREFVAVKKRVAAEGLLP